MDIYLHDIKKKYIREWIIPGITHQFKSNTNTAITGRNGSGKSTLLKLIAGIAPPSSGSIVYKQENKTIDVADAFRSMSFCAPYQELVEELTLRELLKFHIGFRASEIGSDPENLAEAMQLSHAIDKKIFHYSSGMKQRAKLGLALLTSASVTLLDEPTTNLDNFGIDWYLNMVERVNGTRTLIVASNQPVEYSFCGNTIDLSAK